MPAPTLAVMVDLGWPWWVSTIAALAVAAAAAVTFRRSTSSFVRGVAALVVLQGVVMAAAAPFLMPGSSGGSGAMAGAPPRTSAMGGGTASMGGDMGSVAGPATTRLPFTFFFTRYEPLGKPGNRTGIRYRSDGAPVARGLDGATLALSGAGGWDSVSERTAGGGLYTVRDSHRRLTRQGSWTAKRFLSFRQLPGWLPRGFAQQGWQGPRGSQSFSGLLELAVSLDPGGPAVLSAWCVMSDAASRALHRPWDGITLVGPKLRFTGWKVNVNRPAGGVMFYGPGSTS